MTNIPTADAEDKASLRRAALQIESDLRYMRSSGASKKKIAHNEQRLADARAAAGMAPIVKPVTLVDVVTPDTSGASGARVPPEGSKARGGPGGPSGAARAAPDGTSGAEPKLRLLTPEDCKAAVVPDYLVKNVIGQGDVGCIFGHPGAGKSVLAPYLGYMVAQGKPVFGKRTRKGVVLYAAAENEHGMLKRVEGLMQVHGPAPGFFVVGGVSDLTDPDQVAELAAYVHDHKPALVIVDTVRLAFPVGDENTSEGLGPVITQARRIAMRGCAVALIHHPAKADNATTPSGWGGFNGALDWSLQLVRAGQDKIVRGEMRKNRIGALDDISVAFSIDKLILNDRTDSDGDPVDVPTLREVANTPAAKKLPRGAGYALENLRGMIEAAGGESAALNDWRDKCIGDHRISDKEDRDSRRKAFQRAHNHLVDAHHIRHEAGQVFFVPVSRPAQPEYGGFPIDNDAFPI